MDLNKQKLIDSKYTDQNAINYFNNQFKQLVDLEKSTSANLYNTYVLTPDALNYCEDNYLDTDNKFCVWFLVQLRGATQQHLRHTST